MECKIRFGKKSKIELNASFPGGGLGLMSHLMRGRQESKLYQLHHQNISDLERTEMIAQKEWTPENATHSAVADWCKDVASRHPCPEGWQWLMISEDHPQFVWAVKEEENGRSS